MDSKTINKLSIPFGVFIGPMTIISNLAKVIKAIAKLVQQIFYSITYKPSKEDFEKYKNYKDAKVACNKVWEDASSSSEERDLSFIDIGVKEDINKKSIKLCEQYEGYKKNISKFWNNKLPKHLGNIAIGVIRSIPLAGGIGLSIYDVAKAP